MWFRFSLPRSIIPVIVSASCHEFSPPMKHVHRLLLSAACSVFVLGLLLSLAGSLGAGVSPADVATGLRSALAAFVALYALCQLLQTLARARRSQVLLRASMDGAENGAAQNKGARNGGAENGAAQKGAGQGSPVPGLFHLLMVTFVRGACADMLPARLGELSYVAMLNRGCAVPAADCLSSLSIGLLFDFLALLAVLAVSIPAAAQGMSLVGSLVMLAALCVVGVALLFFALPTVAAWRWERWALFRRGPLPLAWALRLARNLADAVTKVRRGRVAGRVLALSLCIRAAKYAGLYALFVAVTRPLWPALSHAAIPAVLVALIAAEGAASLPVPTFLSFGSYEAGGLAALVALGFPAGDSLVAMVTMHILSQIIDYSLGGLAFLVFMWGSPKSEVPRSKSEVRSPKSGGSGKNGWVRLAASLAFFGAACFFAAWEARAAQKRGRLTAPPKGEEIAPTAAEAAARDAALRAFGGKVVWSSNRSGSHDLWILDGPGAEPRRLTRSEYTDTYPRFSPDGTKIAFSRSTEPWVSQRNFEKWDTWVLDLATGEERLVATNAYQACWAECWDISNVLVFVRAGGTQLVRTTLDGGEEEIVLQTGVPPLADGVLVTLPDAQASDPQFALTLRGKHKATARYSLWDAAVGNPPPLRDTAGGCQMVWRKDQSGLGTSDTPVWIDHTGRQKNAIYTLGELGEGGPVVLLDAPEPWSHEYFPRFAEGGRWLVYGASTGGHEQDVADYEIFLWDTAETNAPPARLTFHTGNDCWPDISPIH